VHALRNPVLQFAAAAAVIVVVVALGSARLSRHAAEAEAVADARAMTELLAWSVAQPSVPRGLVYGSRSVADTYDYMMRSSLLIANVERVKIWNAEGRIVYSDKKRLIGQRFELGDDARAVLESGGSEGGVPDLRRPENRYELDEGGLLEVYTRMESPEGEPLLLEIYWANDQLTDSTEVVLDTFRPIAVGGVLLLGLLTTPLLWGLHRRLGRAAEARERLLRSAVVASEEERRRLARDLHEGVVHSLDDASAALAAQARDAATPYAASRRLLEVDESLRGGIASLRSLVLEIYPPDLDANSLAAALDELVAPAESAGIDVTVHVTELPGASDDAVALVWRVAREGVRNVVHHARAHSLAVSVRQSRGRVELRVADDGVGFVPGAFGAGGRFGLRALQDLAAEAGGRLQVTSGPGRGTVLLLDVKAT
jgi:two-component system, NarL family, sensor kinase